MVHSASRSIASLGDLKEVLAGIVACNAVGAASGLAAGPSNFDWYGDLRKPRFHPPAGLFGPVWTLLYTMMGVTLGMVLRGRRSGRRAGTDEALSWFAVQLALNALWSVIFFRLRSPRWALVEIVALIVAIGLTMRALWGISRVAALLLAPYLAWTLFAAVLNVGIVRLNPRAG